MVRFMAKSSLLTGPRDELQLQRLLRLLAALFNQSETAGVSSFFRAWLEAVAKVFGEDSPIVLALFSEE